MNNSWILRMIMVLAVSLLSANSHAQELTNDAFFQGQTSSTNTAHIELFDSFDNADFALPSVRSTSLTLPKIKRQKPAKAFIPIEFDILVNENVNKPIALKPVFLKSRKTNLVFPFHNFW